MIKRLLFRARCAPFYFFQQGTLAGICVCSWRPTVRLTEAWQIKYSILVWDKILIFKASAHSFKQFTSRLLKLSFSLSMHIYNSDGRHAWFHLHGTSRPDRSASEATKYKMKNSSSIVGLEPSALRFQVWCSTYWASRAWWMLYV